TPPQPGRREDSRAVGPCGKISAVPNLRDLQMLDRIQRAGSSGHGWSHACAKKESGRFRSLPGQTASGVANISPGSYVFTPAWAEVTLGHAGDPHPTARAYKLDKPARKAGCGFESHPLRSGHPRGGSSGGGNRSRNSCGPFDFAKSFLDPDGG